MEHLNGEFSVFKKLLKPILILLSLSLIPIASFSMTEHLVAKGDTLWGIAKKYKPQGTSTSEMIKAIKGYNAKSSPAIVDNVVRLGDDLSLPTTADEVKEGIEKLDQLQAGYQSQVQTTKPESTQPSSNNNASANHDVDKIIPVTTMKDVPTQAKPSNNSEAVSSKKTSQINNTPSSSMISSVGDNAQSRVIYPNEIKNKSTEAPEVKQSSTSWIIWVVIIILIILIITRRLKKAKLRNESTNTSKKSSYQRTSPKGDVGFYEPKADLDTSNVSEVLVEAMLLINDDRLEDARHTLQQTLKSHPNSIEVRMKLMEVYAASNDEISFTSERDYLAAHLMSHDDERWHEIDEIYHQYFIARK